MKEILERIERLIQWYGDYDTSHDYGFSDPVEELREIRDLVAAKIKAQDAGISAGH